MAAHLPTRYMGFSRPFSSKIAPTLRFTRYQPLAICIVIPKFQLTDLPVANPLRYVSLFRNFPIYPNAPNYPCYLSKRTSYCAEFSQENTPPPDRNHPTAPHPQQPQLLTNLGYLIAPPTRAPYFVALQPQPPAPLPPNPQPKKIPLLRCV